MKKDNLPSNAKAAFDKWFEEKYAFESPSLNEAIWDYFHREFPREECEECKGWGQVCRFVECKRPAQKQQGCKYCPEFRPCPVCKPKCPTCEGSTKVPIIVGHQCTVFPCYHVRKPCPDCTEKDSAPIYQRKIGDEHYPSPNERKGQQRAGYGRRLAAGSGGPRRIRDRRS